jgi:catechol 2,3-dioxygenase-like lactoylglutathione lyase family enzyme
VTSVYVDHQDKALRFYTEVLGFAKKTDFSQGPYRWLTVASREDRTELQLALNNNPAVKTYQQAIFQQSAHVDALKRHLDRMDQSTRTKRKKRRRR